MFGNRFIRYLSYASPRHLTHLDRFVDYLKYRISDSKNRSNHITPNGYGSRLLVDIIKLSDIDSLLNASDPLTYLSYILKDIEKPVDPRNGRHTTKSLFIKSKTQCLEIISPSRREDSAIAFPVEKDYSDPSWATIKPLRITEMGSCDLHFSVHSGYLHYPSRGPTHCVYTVDCVGLILKFLAYYKYQTNITDIDQTILEFINDEIITPTLLEDSSSIWLRNLYRQQLISGSPLEFHTTTMWDVITTDVIGPDITGGITDIVHMKADLINQSFTPQAVLSSIIVSVDGKSFSEYFSELWNTTRSPSLRPFVWVEALKYITWWETILATASYAPRSPSTISLYRDALRDIRILVMMKPWQEVYKSYPFKSIVKSKIEGLYRYLSSELRS